MKWYLFLLAVLAGNVAWALSNDPSLGVAVFAIALLPFFLHIYIPYAKDNPEGLWFKRKLYGWGWTPVTWQGWLVTIAYVALVILFGLTIDEHSPSQEIAFTFALPFLLLTAMFIRILYKKGEKPKWQWGKPESTDPEEPKA